jgi:poly(3-hydroxybutyrate) depolymerase
VRFPTFLAAAFAAALLAARAAPSVAGDDDLGKALADAVDQPTPAARLAAAMKLAARADVTLDAWVAAMRKFGEFAKPEPGSSTEKATLQVGEVREEATIAVFVPKKYVPGKPAPLLMAFHGSGGEGHDEDSLWTDTAEAMGMIVVAPTDPTADLGYHYSEAERRRALAALRWARRRFDVDETRVYATGVSRGAHLAWDLALRNPDQFAALVPMIGGPRLQIDEGQNNLRYMDNLVQMPIRDLQGAQDDALLIKNLKLAFDRLAAAGAKDAKLLLQPDLGHDFDPHAVDWPKFFGGAVREPVPMRVVRACTRSDEARASWAEATSFQAAVKEHFRADIEERKWKLMDDAGRRDWAQSEADKHTARLEVRLDGPGKFTAKSEQVLRFRLLLSAEMFDPATPVLLTLNDKPSKYDAKPSRLVLLRDFVERFDRTFLPVAEVSCP